MSEIRTAIRKVWRDLWLHKGRTLLVVMSIAAGVLAIGMITTSNTLLQEQLAASNTASMPSHGRISFNRPISLEELENIEDLPGIVVADGRLTYNIQWRKSTQDPWQEATLQALSDYNNQKLDLVELYEGNWPDRDDVVVAYNQIDSFNVPGLSETLIMKVNNRERGYPVNGVMRDPVVQPPPFDETPTFFVSTNTFQKIAGFDSYFQARITTSEYSEEAVLDAADQIEHSLRRVGVEVDFVTPTDPSDHWAQGTMDGVGLIMAIMAVSALALSTFLILNTMNALMMQQTAQIGMMKTIGGLRRQITTIYLAGVAVYGILALFIAVPGGAIAGNALGNWLLTFVNIPPEPFSFVRQSLGLQFLTGLLAPILAGLYPILRGVRIPVARAINSYGIGQGQYGFRFFDRMMTRIRRIPRLATLTLRNTFRRLGRVVITQITLTIAGAVFMMVLTTQQSFQYSIDRIFDGFGFDVLMVFEQDQRINKIVPLAESRPNITHAEMWIFSSGYVRPVVPQPGAISNEEDVDIRGVPSDSELYIPQIVAGRDLRAEDGHAILFNQKIASELGVSIGDQVVIEMDGHDDSTWTIVGLILDLGANARQQSIYVHRETLAMDLNHIGRSSVLEIKGVGETVEEQLAIENNLSDFFEKEGLHVAYSTTALENKDLANAQFSILTTILLLMTILIATVGGLGLSGTLSINVMERTREIGVMRAVGASSIDIGQIFMGEGLLLGLLSWLLAVPVSAAAGIRFVQALGEIIDFPFDYRYSAASIWLWFGLIVLISISASWLPSRRATRISVRESLAYE